MLWQEEDSQETLTVRTVVDLVFSIHCRCLPLDHAYALSQAISQILPWFAEEPQAGLHLIHTAGSGNGWHCLNEPGSLMYLARRTKLTLRLPQHCLIPAQALTGMTLEVGDYVLQVGNAVVKSLTSWPVLFARHVAAHVDQEEEVFLADSVATLGHIGISCRKVMCGTTSYLSLPEGPLLTRGLMVADLKPQESLLLQQHGLGKGRKHGCGLFVPHKDIKPVNQNTE